VSCAEHEREIQDFVANVKGALIPIGSVTSGFPLRLVEPGPEPADGHGSPRDPQGFWISLAATKLRRLTDAGLSSL
jgi:hypothetical protein